MQLLGRYEMKSREKVEEFLRGRHICRIATIDADGCPQVIPMNFALVDGRVYMHSHTRGEKLDNVRRNPKVGVEVDRELEFLPSYFEDPKDASLADTLYVSVVIKGTAAIVEDREEKATALNSLMKKYQPEGGYEPIRANMKVVDHVSVIRVTPETMRGKYKVGQHVKPEARIELARKILERGTPTAEETLGVMGFEVKGGELVDLGTPQW